MYFKWFVIISDIELKKVCLVPNLTACHFVLPNVTACHSVLPNLIVCHSVNIAS